MSEIPGSINYRQELRRATRRVRDGVRKLSRGKRLDYRQYADVDFVIRFGHSSSNSRQLVVLEHNSRPDFRRTDVYFLAGIATRRSVLVGDEEMVISALETPDSNELEGLLQRIRRSQRVLNPPPFVGFIDPI